MRKVIVYIVLIIIFISFAGCASFDVGSMMQGPSGSKSASSPEAAGEDVKTISGLSNNAEKQLEAGTYKGLTIDANSVVLTGRGQGKTVIAGDVVIKKNNCVIKNLTIRGNVVIEGNNADLTGAEIKGQVDSKGKNNSWSN